MDDGDRAAAVADVLGQRAQSYSPLKREVSLNVRRRVTGTVLGTGSLRELSLAPARES